MKKEMTCIIHKKGNGRKSDSHSLINNASLDFVNWKSIPLNQEIILYFFWNGWKFFEQLRKIRKNRTGLLILQ